MCKRVPCGWYLGKRLGVSQAVKAVAHRTGMKPSGTVCCLLLRTLPLAMSWGCQVEGLFKCADAVSAVASDPLSMFG